MKNIEVCDVCFGHREVTTGHVTEVCGGCDGRGFVGPLMDDTRESDASFLGLTVEEMDSIDRADYYYSSRLGF